MMVDFRSSVPKYVIRGLVLAYSGFVLWTLIMGMQGAIQSRVTFYSVTYDGIISRVDTNSPAEEAGLRVGDQVLTVNGQPFDWLRPPLHEIYMAVQQELRIDRGDEIVTVLLTTARKSLSERIQHLMIPATGFLLFCFALILWLRNPNSVVVTEFVVCFLAVAFTMTPRGTDVYWPALVAFSLAGFNLWAISLFLLLVCLRLSFKGSFDNFVRWAAPSLYGLGAIWLGILVWYAQNGRFAQPWLNWIADAGNLFFWSLIVAISIITIGYLVAAPASKRRLRYLFVGTVVTLAFWAITIIGPSVLYNQPPLIPYYIITPTILILPSSFALAIYKHELVVLERVYNRTLVHLFLFMLLIFGYLLLLANLPPSFAVSLVANPIGFGLLTIGLAITFVPLRNKIQQLMDRWLYGGWYDYRTMIDALSPRLASLIRREELGSVLVDELATAMHLNGAALLLPEGEAWILVRAAGDFGRRPLTDVPLTLHQALVAAKRPLTSSELPQTTLTDKVALWVPLLRQDSLLGLLLLGQQAGGEPFAAVDKQMLAALSWNAATAVANIQLVETLSQRATEINKLYHQLITSREEERKRLARNLHDSAIQELVHLNRAVSIEPDNNNSLQKKLLHTIGNELRGVVDVLRDVCTDLRPPAIDDLGLRLAIEGFLADTTAENNLQTVCEMHCSDPFLATLSDAVQLTLFRVLQEAISNVLRHAQAETAVITLTCTNDEIVLTIEDNGRGFMQQQSTKQLLAADRFGIVGMRERLHLLGGTLSFQAIPAPRQGTRLIAVIPIRIE